jgi:hypothetical protein
MLRGTQPEMARPASSEAGLTRIANETQTRTYADLVALVLHWWVPVLPDVQFHVQW